jgi:predicted Zn-dependent protease
MKVKPTGNGRRESYAHVPMPRMTNTYMLSGDKAPEEIVASIKKGLYATNFGGGDNCSANLRSRPAKRFGSRTVRFCTRSRAQHCRVTALTP